MLLTLLLTLGILLPSPPSSIVTLTSGNGVCTAFSIDQAKGIFLTAFHCLNDNLQIEEEEVKVVGVNEGADLAMVQSTLHHYPALQLGPAPDQGAQVTMMGRIGSGGFLLSIPNTLHGASFDDDGYRLVFEGKEHVVPGMSGGPILDREGRVVSVVQCYYLPPDILGGDSCGAMYQDVQDAYAMLAKVK